VLAQKQVEELLDRREPPVMVEAGEVVGEAEAALDPRLSEPGLDRLLGGSGGEVSGKRLLPFPRRGDRRPG